MITVDGVLVNRKKNKKHYIVRYDGKVIRLYWSSSEWRKFGFTIISVMRGSQGVDLSHEDREKIFKFLFDDAYYNIGWSIYDDNIEKWKFNNNIL